MVRGEGLSFVQMGFEPEPIKPLPPSPPLDARKVALGDRLFHDKRLSKDNSLSCASCHNLSRGGVDGRPTSIGI